MNSMRDACGPGGPLLLNLEGRGSTQPECVTFENPFVVIGSHPRADLCLPTKDVAERHAYLQLIDGHLFVVDLGSRGGTFLDGRPVRAGWVGRGQTLRIGSYKIRHTADDRPDSAPAVPPAGSALASTDNPAFPPLGLQILLRGIRPIEAEIKSRLSLVGSATDCQVRLLDPTVASHHAALLYTPTGLWIVDLLGQGGTAVNGEAVRSALWADGDEVAVGRSTVRLGSGSSSSPNPGARVSASKATPPGARGPAAAAPPRPAVSVVRPVSILEPPADPADPPRDRQVVETPSYVGKGNGRQPKNQEPLAVSTHADGPSEESSVTEDTREGGGWLGFKNRLNGVVGLPKPSLATRPAPRRKARPSDPFAVPAESCPDDRPTVDGEPMERRSSCRYLIANTQGSLAWWNDSPEEALAPASSPAEGLVQSALMGREPGVRGRSVGLREAADEPSAQRFEKWTTCPVQLFDVSQTGLAVIGTQAPERNSHVCFRLENEPLFPDWVEVDFVGTSPFGAGNHLIRLRFKVACPYEMFKFLVFSGRSSLR